MADNIETIINNKDNNSAISSILKVKFVLGIMAISVMCSEKDFISKLIPIAEGEP